MIYLALWFNSLALVFIKASQQLHVVRGQWVRVIPTSYVFALFEVMLIAKVANHNGLVLTAFAVGTGAWMGALTAMWFNRRY